MMFQRNCALKGHDSSHADVLKGHDFSHADVLKGHDFSYADVLKGHDLPGSSATGLRRWGGLSRADTAAKPVGALAPEGCSEYAGDLSC
jgi:hypothetical protein